MLEFIILGTLYYHSLTGYDIRKCVEGGIGMFYKASYGSIYPLLGRLSEKGAVVCTDEAQGKRTKKIYSITDLGKREFMTWLEAEDTGDSIESFMAKVFFFDQLPVEFAYEKISAYEERLLEYQDNLMAKKEVFDKANGKKDFYYKLSTLYFGICKLQSLIGWCETVKIGGDLRTLQVPFGKKEGITDAEYSKN